MANKPISPDEVRREIVHAIFLEDRFYDAMALKGGAALLAHAIGSRASLDVDVSLRGDFDEAEFDSSDEAGRTMQRALEKRFFELGYQVFDYKFERKPSHIAPEEVPEHWGGYMSSFKLANAKQFADLGVEEMRRRAIETEPHGKRTFKIDISRREYVGEPDEIETGGGTWRVYTPWLLLYEKLRALCQQHPSYAHATTVTLHRRRRPKDFLDIYEIVNKCGRCPKDPAQLQLELRACFEAKKVPLELLLTLGDEDTREYHREGWEGVIDTTTRKLEPYEHYHDFVAELALEYSTLTSEAVRNE